MKTRRLLLWRDVVGLRGQGLAIVGLVACAVAAFVGSVGTYRSLDRARVRFYDERRLPDLFVSLRRAPEPVGAQLAAIPGVAEVETRLVADVPIEVPGLAEPATARLLGLPDGRQPRQSQLHLLSGRLPGPGAKWEFVAGEAFVEANRLQLGSAVRARVNGRHHELRLVGVALSPEHVYQARPGDAMPDDRRFGVLWLDHAVLAGPLDMEGAFNDAVLRLGPGARPAEVLAAIDRLLAPYGGLGAFGRDRHASTRFLDDEIRQLQSTAVTLPTILLAVVVFLLHVILGRVVLVHRERIGMLKAFGLSDAAIGRHYAALAACLVLLGTAAGVAGGGWLEGRMTAIYGHFYRLPEARQLRETWLPALAGLLALGAGVAGSLGAVRSAARLPPAEAMQPAAPMQHRPTWLDRAALLGRLPATARLVARNLGRHPGRAAASIVGISLAVAVLVVGLFFDDSMSAIVSMQFGVAQHEDATVAFNAPLAPSAIDELRALPGVRQAEPYRALPVRLTAGHRHRHVSLTGLPSTGTLRRVAGVRQGRVAVPSHGLLLTDALGEALGVGPGDLVTVEVLEGRRPARTLPVAGLVDEPIGLQAYLALERMGPLLDQEDAPSGAFLRVEPGAATALWPRLSALPQVAGVGLRAAQRRAFEELGARYIRFFAAVLVAFAAAIACGVVYNSARMALAERIRELATLRVLGFSRVEVLGLLCGELGLEVALALPLGSVLGWCLAAGISASGGSELFRIPLVVTASSYLIAASVVVLAAIAAMLGTRRLLARLDLATAVKVRE